MEWVTRHLGHTLNVHKISYRMTSEDIERSQVAKILLLQDHGAENFANKALKDISMEGKVR